MKRIIFTIAIGFVFIIQNSFSQIINASCTTPQSINVTISTTDNCNFRAGFDQTVQVNIPTTGDWTFTTCGTPLLNTFIYLSTANCSGLIASNDDACGSQSTITMTGLAAGTYYVDIEGFTPPLGGEPCILTVAGTCPVPPPTINANCAAPQSIASTIGTADNCAFRTGFDQTIVVNIPTTGDWTFSTCTGTTFDTYIYLSSGNCAGLLASDNDGCATQSSITMTGLVAGTYYVDVEGNNPPAGGEPFTLTVTGICPVILPTINADCNIPQSVSSTISMVDNCNFRTGFDQTVQVNIPDTGTWTFSLCGGATWDTYLFLSTGNCLGQLASNDDGCALQSTITMAGLLPGTYYVDVEGYNEPAGGEPFTLTVTGNCTAPPPPPSMTADCSTPQTYSGTISMADNCGFRTGNDQTVQVNIPAFGDWTFALCGGATWDTYLILSSGNCSGQLADNDDGCGLQSTVTMFGIPAGTYYVDVEGYNPPAGGEAFTLTVTGTCPGPEMDVQGNGISIPDGNTSTSVADNTDFGSVLECSGTISQIFTIENTGGVDLNLTGTPIIVIGGTDAADFTVTVDPTTPVAPAVGGTSFTITFDPSGVGTRTATISIANDDSDENPYDFSIKGNGLADVTAPVSDVDPLPGITNDCVVNLSAPTATDDCAGTIAATTTDPVSYNTPGTYLVTWTYDDGNGNTTSQTQNVTVNDSNAPFANNSNIDTTAVCTITLTAPTATDNCEGIITGTTGDPTTYNEGVYSVTWTYDDGNGNTSTQVQNITVTECVGVNELANDLLVNIFPNPNNGVFTLSLNIIPDNELRVQLVTSLGQIVYSGILQSQNQEFDFGNLSPSIYYLQIFSSGGMITKQVIIK